MQAEAERNWDFFLIFPLFLRLFESFVRLKRDEFATTSTAAETKFGTKSLASTLALQL